MKHLRILSLLLIIATLLSSVGFAASEKTRYVVYETLTVMKGAGSNTGAVGVVGYGTKVTVESTSGEWSKISGGGYKGYVKTHSLSDKNPCTLKQTMYAKKDIKVYMLPQTGAKSSTIKSGSGITVDGKFSSWYRVNKSGTIGYVKQSDLSATKPTAESAVKTSSPKTYYVVYGTATVYAKADGTKATTTLGYGTKVNVTGTSGKYSAIKCGSVTGYCKSSTLSTKDPNTLNTTVYAKKEIKFYALPKTDAKTTTVKVNTKMTTTGKVDSWYRVNCGGNIGYVKTADVSTKQVTVSTETKVSKTSYVSSGTTKVYASASTSASVKGTLVFGTKCTVSAVDGSFSKVTSGSVTGYVKTSTLTDKNPNTMSKKVYPQSKSITVYSYPSTGANTATVSYSTALTATAQYDSTWIRVTYSGKVAFAKASDLGTKKYDGVSTSKPASGKSKTMDWFKSGIQSIFYKGCVATVTDVKTGISWKVKRSGGSNHADVQPLTAADTAAMKKACGSDFGTWHRRAIWVSIGGQKYAASMNCMPHGNGNITNNNFDGHHCIHFLNSKTHGTNKVDPDHQATIKKALAAG